MSPDIVVPLPRVRAEERSIRVVLRDLERTLTDDDANELRDRMYAAIHEDSAWIWAPR